MRCPKCGYISFDHMETCLKCKKDISGSTDVEGTTYHASVPSFLQVPKKIDPVGQETASAEITEDVAEDKYDFADPNLDVFLDDDDDISIEETDEEEGGIDFADPDSADFQLETDDQPETDEEDDEGIDFDFELDGDDDLDLSDDEQGTAPTLSIPDEVADITDLSPPGQGDVAAVSSANEMGLSLDDDMKLDEDLDLDGLDLDLDLGFGADKNDAETELSLSMDDIDLSAGDITKDSSELDNLSLDLDLDGLDSSPVAEKEKSSGSLDGISLSLD